MFDFHFISGLPRSGTTLLASILRQNPNFYAHIESPTGRLFVDTIATLGCNSEAGIMVGPEQRRHIQRYMMHGYYQPLDLPENCTVFDNNRKWCANISALMQVFPNAYVFALARPVAEIVDSFERVFAQNPLYASAMALGRANLTVYDRVNLLLHAQEGVVGWSYNALRAAFYGPERHRLNVIDYEDLARFPLAMLEMLYKKLDLPLYEHAVNRIQQIPGVEEFDRRIGAPGMHQLGVSVQYNPIPSQLPPDILQHLHKTYPCFWRKA